MEPATADPSLLTDTATSDTTGSVWTVPGAETVSSVVTVVIGTVWSVGSVVPVVAVVIGGLESVEPIVAFVVGTVVSVGVVLIDSVGALVGMYV